MIYNIEISFSVFHHNTLANWIKNTAYEYGCSSYELVDIERNNHCVLHIQFQFEQQHGSDITSFLSFIQNMKKIPNVHIESIYSTDEMETEIQLLFASSHYLKTIDKHIALSYRLNRRKRSYSEDDSKIIELFSERREKRDNEERKDKKEGMN